MPKCPPPIEDTRLDQSNASSLRDAPVVSRSLELPEGYQHFGWYTTGVVNHHGVTLDNPDTLMLELERDSSAECYFYTSHQIEYENGLIKQTRSSPNWEGGMVTYATCKHLMRTTNKPTWEGIWIATVGPKECENNTLVCVGKIWRSFPSNYTLRGCLKSSYPEIFKIKCADSNPRGDLYTPRRILTTTVETNDHHNYSEPPKHTRSVEFYKKSPGSVSERKDGLIPKWWRDMEYIVRETRPPVFILSPCWIFSTPMMWSSRSPKRASLRMTVGSFMESLYV